MEKELGDGPLKVTRVAVKKIYKQLIEKSLNKSKYYCSSGKNKIK